MRYLQKGMLTEFSVFETYSWADICLNSYFFKHQQNKTSTKLKIVSVGNYNIIFFHQRRKQLCSLVWVASDWLTNTHHKPFRDKWLKSAHLFDLCKLTHSLQKRRCYENPTYTHKENLVTNQKTSNRQGWSFFSVKRQNTMETQKLHFLES